MEFRILGPLEVRDGDRTLPLGGPKQRALLAMLLIHAARIAAIEDRVDADLALGRHHELIGEVEGLVRVHPGRERLTGQLMIALYRDGRQSDALAAYRRARQHLADELGVDPGPQLRKLEKAILDQDPALDAPPSPTVPALVPSPASPEPAGPRAEPIQRAGGKEERRVVSLLSCLLTRPPSGSGDP